MLLSLFFFYAFRLGGFTIIIIIIITKDGAIFCDHRFLFLFSKHFHTRRAQTGKATTGGVFIIQHEYIYEKGE